MPTSPEQSKSLEPVKAGLGPRLAFILACAIICGGILLLNVLTLESSFQRYSNTVDLRRVEPIARFLEERYQNSGSWDFLNRDFDAIRALSPPPGPDFQGAMALRGPAGEGGRLPGPPDGGPARGGRAPGGPPQHVRELARRVAIYDSRQKRLWGSELADDSGSRRELLSAGKTIGYIALAPGISPSADADADFVRERITTYASGSALSLAVLLFLGEYLLKEAAARRKKLTQALKLLQDGHGKNSLAADDDPELMAAFNSLADNLAELDRGHRQWVADTSHELRTPIAVLRAQVEAFQDGVQEITPRNMSVLHGEIMALGKLVDDLHWLSKHDVGQIKANSVAVDINQSLQDVLESFEERREAKEIKLENKVPPDEKLIAYVDASRIRQVLTNLTENSLRHTNKGGTLRISHAIDSPFLKLYFDDTEPGVSDEALPHIFDRFFRVEPSRSRTLGGSGLGLAICQNNMQLLGGKIEAGHSPLGGLRIELTLPMVHIEQ